jgi:SH3-like domain-containing protein
MMSVQVREGQIRSTPSFLAPIIGVVAYGEQVETLRQQGDWIDVKSAQTLRGWIHQSALTTKRVVLSAGGEAAPVAASGQEVALAGKGFNEDVESKYSRTHKEADYTWVDKMEQITITPKDMLSFLKEGGVRPVEGGVR